MRGFLEDIILKNGRCVNDYVEGEELDCNKCVIRIRLNGDLCSYESALIIAKYLIREKKLERILNV